MRSITEARAWMAADLGDLYTVGDVRNGAFSAIPMQNFCALSWRLKVFETKDGLAVECCMGGLYSTFTYDTDEGFEKVIRASAAL